jgi:thiol-disulfide isomerase/thioredoxin
MQDPAECLAQAYRNYERAQLATLLPETSLFDVPSPSLVVRSARSLRSSVPRSLRSSAPRSLMPLWCLLALVIVVLVLCWRPRRRVFGQSLQELSVNANAAPILAEARAISSLDELGDELTLVMFWADGCGHCTAMKPDFARLAREEPRASFRLCSAEALGARARELDLTGFPTVVAFRGRRPVAKLVGNRGLAALQDFVARQLS